MHPLLTSLLAHAPVVTDGAWGTELQKQGLAPGEHPDLWNLSHPDRVEEVASRYVEAGSAVILTNPFRSNRIALASHGGGVDAAALNAAGVGISRKAARGFCSIALKWEASGQDIAARKAGGRRN